MINFFLKTAYLLGQESKCVSKQVGALIVLDNRIISTGYNGTPKGYKNCNEVFNPNDFDREEHHKWSKIHEAHAELNSIAFAARNDIGIEGADIYTILQPCDQCLLAIIAAGIKKIYYVYTYDKSDKNNDLWDMIEYEQVKDDELLHWLAKEHNFQLIKSKKFNTIK